MLDLLGNRPGGCRVRWCLRGAQCAGDDLVDFHPKTRRIPLGTTVGPFHPYVARPHVFLGQEHDPAFEAGACRDFFNTVPQKIMQAVGGTQDNPGFFT